MLCSRRAVLPQGLRRIQRQTRISDMSAPGTDKPTNDTERSPREEFGDELSNPGANTDGRTGAGAGPTTPSEAEADAATGRDGDQAGTSRDGDHEIEDGGPKTSKTR